MLTTPAIQLTSSVAAPSVGRVAGCRRLRQRVASSVAAIPQRNFAAEALRQDPEPSSSSSSSHSYSPSTTTSRFSSPRSQPPRTTRTQRRPLTEESASSYLSTLLSLPPSRPFPPSLALQTLTHKSFRGSHVLSQSSSSPTSLSSDPVGGGAPTNSRLTFLGKRAFKSYFLMFVHREALTSPGGLDGLGLGDLEERLDGLMHPLNLGREIGQRWELEDFMRWGNPLDRYVNDDPQKSGSLRIQGETVQAILGSTMMHFGSPSAHRLFHTQIFPHLSRQLRNEGIREAVDVTSRSMTDELEGGGVVVP